MWIYEIKYAKTDTMLMVFVLVSETRVGFNSGMAVELHIVGRGEAFTTDKLSHVNIIKQISFVYLLFSLS